MRMCGQLFKYKIEKRGLKNMEFKTLEYLFAPLMIFEYLSTPLMFAFVCVCVCVCIKVRALEISPMLSGILKLIN